MFNQLSKITVLTLFQLSFLVNPSKSEIVTNYNEFTGKTTVSTQFEKDWQKNAPRLSLRTEFSGRSSQELPSLIWFYVTIPMRHSAQCLGLEQNPISGIVADGKRIMTYDQKRAAKGGMPMLNLKSKSQFNGHHFTYWEIYEAEEFKQIVHAQNVQYQLCGDDSQVYSLDIQEKRELKQFYDILSGNSHNQRRW